jgi:hypothetical protein
MKTLLPILKMDQPAYDNTLTITLADPKPHNPLNQRSYTRRLSGVFLRG